MTREILDPSIDMDAWVPARRSRMLLAAGIDWILFSSFLQLSQVFLQSLVPSLFETSKLHEFILFGVVESLLFWLIRWSPGAQILGVRFVSIREFGSGVDGLWQALVPYVSREIKNRESWYTILLALMIFSEGCKSLVRWTMWNPPMPLFGQPADETVNTIISVVSGGLQVVVAIWLFRANIRGVILGIVFYSFQLASIVLSWNLLTSWGRAMVEGRRDYQGLMARQGEIESIQSLVPELLLATGGGLLLFLCLSGWRIRRRTTS